MNDCFWTLVYNPFWEMGKNSVDVCKNLHDKSQF
jgi:hypothetical protein